jgi:hypothetical protein
MWIKYTTWKHSQYFLVHFDLLQLQPLLCLADAGVVIFTSSCKGHIKISPKFWIPIVCTTVKYEDLIPYYLVEHRPHTVQSWEQMPVDYEIRYDALSQQLSPETLFYYHSFRKHNRRHRRVQHQNNRNNCKVPKSKYIDFSYHIKYGIKTYTEIYSQFQTFTLLTVATLRSTGIISTCFLPTEQCNIW